MLRSINKILDTDISAKDGEIGRVHDFYFDDLFWKVRYFVGDTGNWLSGQRVLLAPESVGSPNWFHNVIPVDLTKEQIKNSPPFDDARPVSRQYIRSLHDYYSWKGYWLLDDPYSSMLAHQIALKKQESQPEGEEFESAHENNEIHLRSAREVIGYYIDAKNGSIGHVEDFLVNDDDWRIEYMVVDTRNWWPGGKKVLVAPHWIEDINWAASHVKVELSRAVIKNGPEFDYEQVTKADSLV